MAILKSFKQFMKELGDNISEAESVRRYEEYRCQSIRRKAREFFETHITAEWNVDYPKGFIFQPNKTQIYEYLTEIEAPPPFMLRIKEFFYLRPRTMAGKLPLPHYLGSWYILSNKLANYPRGCNDAKDAACGLWKQTKHGKTRTVKEGINGPMEERTLKFWAKEPLLEMTTWTLKEYSMNSGQTLLVVTTDALEMKKAKVEEESASSNQGEDQGEDYGVEGDDDARTDAEQQDVGGETSLLVGPHQSLQNEPFN